MVGGKVTWEKTGTDAAIYYSYDASGKLWAIQYGGSTYFYIRNGQGDITRLIDSAGDTVVEYAYDAWGQLLGTTGSLAATLGADNPYRYRGYRFDGETGLYYLQSRYYNPNRGRFVNADSQLNPGSGSSGLNMFAYCGNNPVNMIDPTGHYAIWGDDNDVIYDRKTGKIIRIKIKTRYELVQEKLEGSDYENGKAPTQQAEKDKYQTGKTTQWGTSVYATCFLGLTFSEYIVKDETGKSEIQCSIGFLMGTPSIGTSIFSGQTNAGKNSDLTGLGMAAGGTLGVAGGEGIFGLQTYEGSNTYLCTPGSEIHCTVSISWTVYEFE